MTEPSDDERLERAFRDGLHRRAADVEVPPGFVDRAIRAARPRHRRLAVAGAALAAAAVFVVAFAIDADPRSVHEGHGTSDQSSAPPTSAPTSASTSEPSPVAAWRTEAWHGVQVQVPADWGWGAAPPACQVGPALAAGGSPVGYRSATPYVGRPIDNADSCDETDRPPAAPYVWLGSDTPTGTVDLAGGYTQETVEADAVRVTVATRDDALRQQILASVTVAACPASVVGPLPQAMSLPDVGLGRPRGAQVCVYQRERELELAYAVHLDAAAAQAYLATAEHDVEQETVTSCPTDELVVVRLDEVSTVGQADGVQQTVVNLTCGWVTLTRHHYFGLDQATKLAVARVGGLPVVLHSEIGTLP